MHFFLKRSYTVDQLTTILEGWVGSSTRYPCTEVEWIELKNSY